VTAPQSTVRYPLASAKLPLIPTTSVGSMAPPGWLVSAACAIERDEFGTADIDELLTDAVDVAVLDQQRAGVDVLVDGEMRRQDFNLGFYGHLMGLEARPLPRRLGPEGHDQRGKWLVTEPLSAPNGLGVVAEFGYLLSVADRPAKACVPGPFTLSGRLDGGTVYRDRLEMAWALVPIVNAECQALVAAGAEFIQIDEPSAAVYPDRLDEYIKLFNAAIDGVQAKIAVHLCFGNFRGRPVARRSYKPLFPRMFDFRADQFLLEFANREMTEVELLREFPPDRELAAGLVDVKNYWCEPPEIVADRVRTLLKFISPEQLWVLPDCGFSQTARWAAVRKLRALVEGVQIVRQELSGCAS
jgi:5-methyltetrahydropteroyltriglutamate--homocysteine methyltransferase